MTRPEEMTLAKIISGGQTGVDRGALDAALERDFPCGGSCPENRAAEDGTIPARYPLTPLAGAGFSERTLQNVLDADGTVIFSHGAPRGGTRLTLEVCQRQQKPFLVIDAVTTSTEEAVVAMNRFLREHPIRVLNIAGPRASEWPEGHAFVLAVMREVLAYVPGAMPKRQPMDVRATLRLIVVDAIAFLFVPYLAAVIRAGTVAAVEAKYGPLWPRAMAFAIVLLISMAVMGLYSTRLRASYLTILIRIAASVCVATVLMVLFFYVFEHLYIGRLLIVTTAMLAFAAAALVRLVMARNGWTNGHR